MAKVILDRLWIHDADNLTDFVTCFSELPARTVSRDGEVRRYAAGRLRTVTRVGRTKTIEVTLIDIAASQRAKLERWLGGVVMWRDDTGELLFGSFFALDVEEYPQNQGCSVSLTLNEATRSVQV